MFVRADPARKTNGAESFEFEIFGTTLTPRTQNGQFPGAGSSFRNVAPGGARYVTMFSAGAPLSLRARCA